MSKDVIIAGAIAVGCIALIAVAFIAPKSKSSSEAESPKNETTTTTFTDPGFGATGGMAPGGLDPMNPTGGINTLPPIGSNSFGSTSFGSTSGGTAGMPPTNPHGLGTTTGGFSATGGFSTGGSTGSSFDTRLINPSPVALPVDMAPVTAQSKTHSVANGELLGDIALKYYKSSKQWRKIAEANPGIDPKNLKVGQKLIIPGVEAKTAAATVNAAAGERTYTIKSGDTLYVVAKKELGSASRWKEIEKLNGVSSNELHVGQVIRLPAASSTATPTIDPLVPSAVGGKTHTVVKGETLGDISKQYYGTTKNWKKIVDANPGTSPEGLKVGQKLAIPEVAGSTAAPTPNGADFAPAVSEYVIKAGDTLSSIAQKELGSTNRWKDLQEANPGLDPRTLRAGQKIKIPGKKSDAAPAAPEKVMPPPASPFGNPGFGAPGANLPGAPVNPALGQNASFGAPVAGQQPSNFPADPTFTSPYGGANFGEPTQPFGQTGPGFSQTGTIPNGLPSAPPSGQFPGQPSPFGAPGAGSDSALR